MEKQMKSQEVAKIFREIAQILELKGDNPFRIRAYERAAQNVENLGENLEIMAREDKLATLPGIGSDLAEKIKEIISRGTLKYYEKLKKDIPSGLIDMLNIQGLGPKTVKLIYDKLGVDTVAKLEKAAKSGKLRKIEGIREKTEENILRGIELLRKSSQRIPLYFALPIANKFLEQIKKMKEVKEAQVAGSLRRQKETIRDIDILVISKEPEKVMDKFTTLSLVSEVLAKGETKSSVIARDAHIQVDLRVVEERSFGSALMYFTGSKDFNIKLRQLAIKKKYKINEYGVFSAQAGKKEKFLAGKTEEEIFSLMGMAYIPPELREDRGELKKALAKDLPKLVEFKDLRGDFHVHSNYSDGKNSILDIAKQAKHDGYAYIGIADHSQSLKIARGLSPKEVYRKIEEVKKINQKLEGIRVLCGTEVDILSEGELDYSDKVLKELDFVIAAIHSGFKQSKTQLTKRIISACKNKYVNMIAHPTGILWGVRDAYEIDLDEILKVARDYKVALEINCYPQRLDLNDLSVMRAKAEGVKLFLGTDAHDIGQLDFMKLGLSVARRGWLEKKDLLNCMSLEKLLKWLKK